MAKEDKINVHDQLPLKWPDGWLRTPIGDRKPQAGWKKTFRGYHDGLVKELARMGVTEIMISFNPDPSSRMDPGVAAYFSRPMIADYSWQAALEIDTPAPTLAQIDDAFRHKAKEHHPDRGGDIKIFQMLEEHRRQARAWVLGTHGQEHEFTIPCDKFTEPRLNLNAIRLGVAAIRQLDRVGIPGMLERAFRGFKTALPAHASTEAKTA